MVTVFNLFLTAAVCCIGAAALDTTYFYQERTHLQLTADATAHAALFRRNQGSNTATAARTAAMQIAAFDMPSSAFGEVIQQADIQFGTWDTTTGTFQDNAASKSAVLVTASRATDHNNPASTFLFRMVGIDSMDVRASAIYATYQPACLRDGITAQGLVDIQSGSQFLKGFCIHSNSNVKVGNNNTFQSGTIVSMPDATNIQMGGSGLAQNPGLQDALRSDEFDIRILDRIRTTATDPLDVALKTPSDDDRPAYITAGSGVRSLTSGANVTYNSTSSFTEGLVHTRDCTSSGNTLTLTGPSGGITYKNFVLITNCLVSIAGNVTLDNVVIYTTNTSDTSVSVSTAGGGGGSSQGLWVGRNDACSPGSGAQIITRGGFKNSAALYLYGAQIVALGPVAFSSNATGEGAAITSGSTVSGTSNLKFSGCDTGMEQNFTAAYFQLVQ
ncbi:TadG family pilus assembly protein [Rubellimicrobium mesophilum]|uniref:TadG family pilus assembly protein n=1 Tax=Rubellimicrobium mesophilum TaxID=1123067 RepID=UPI000687332C|nr:pilus assembly protein TadG-related protein [Rubellimicrobium mesophilum]